MKIRLGSITYAMKAKDLLLSYGIDATVAKDLHSASGGCIYAIAFQDRYRDAVYGILEQAGFPLPEKSKRDELG